MKKVYLLPGMGCDARLYKNLSSKLPFTVLDWNLPESSQTIESYAAGMTEKIDQSAPFVLGGVSFGGIVACEMAYHCHPDAVILISSASTVEELPFFHCLAGFSKYFSTSLIRSLALMSHLLMGIKIVGDKEVFKEMIRSCDERWLKWSLTALSRWRRKAHSIDLVRIHGDNDKMIPLKRMKVDYLIKGGTHTMI